MSDLSKTTLTAIYENSCELHIEIYENNEDSRLNDALQTDESLLKASLFAFLLEIALGEHRKGTTKVKLVEWLMNESFGEVFYHPATTDQFIVSAEILTWKQGLKKELNVEEKEEYENMKAFMNEEELHNYFFGREDLQFSARLTLKDESYLDGLAIGDNCSSALDTFICNWL
jgi:hypothetical protein